MTHPPQMWPDAAQFPAELLTTNEAAELLACSPRTVLRLIERDYLPALRLGPGRTAHRIPAAALRAFTEAYGTHEPHEVAHANNPAKLPTFTAEPVTLVVTTTPDGLTLVEPYQPPAALLED
ncbi:helix-turn-helix domain-containing protein [Deinococcus aquatilis]|uniref:helix-turn-helix domain-containing protein n=1 Tax=Deinococcus aquatilis TaxID=519440 RepID=UPI00036846EF|nr:helix-turn-helix domain-containing protein [Deinococcus aquatilis]